MEAEVALEVAAVAVEARVAAVAVAAAHAAVGGVDLAAVGEDRTEAVLTDTELFSSMARPTFGAGCDWKCLVPVSTASV